MSFCYKRYDCLYIGGAFASAVLKSFPAYHVDDFCLETQNEQWGAWKS